MKNIALHAFVMTQFFAANTVQGTGALNGYERCREPLRAKPTRVAVLSVEFDRSGLRAFALTKRPRHTRSKELPPPQRSRRGSVRCQGWLLGNNQSQFDASHDGSRERTPQWRRFLSWEAVNLRPLSG
jgi:hypothetical protein